MDGTRPATPSTMRTMSGARPRGGMKSMTRTTPSAVSCTVSRISVSAPIAAARPRDRAGGREPPPTMLRHAEQRREAGGGIEAGQAAPVDRAVAADERRRLQIAEQRVVFDPRHDRQPRPHTPPGHATFAGELGARRRHDGRFRLGVDSGDAISAKGDARHRWKMNTSRHSRSGSTRSSPGCSW